MGTQMSGERLADRIRMARVAEGLDRADLACAISYYPRATASERTVRRWESGANRPRRTQAFALSQLLGIEIESFRAGWM